MAAHVVLEAQLLEHPEEAVGARAGQREEVEGDRGSHVVDGAMEKLKMGKRDEPN